MYAWQLVKKKKGGSQIVDCVNTQLTFEQCGGSGMPAATQLKSVYNFQLLQI